LSEQFKHEALVENRFKKSFRNIDSEHQELIFEKMKQLLNNEIQGEYLRGPYKGLKKVRVGKYRIIFSDHEPCKVIFYDVRPRESAYT
jgi:mRNA-degrading endonuclease RelE of RelBE toxin-antitoxin system